MRRQLLLLTGATTALVLAALLVPLALLARSHAADRATADAAQRAQSLAAVVGGALGGDGSGGTATVRAVAESANGPGLPRTSVLLPDGRVLGAPAEVTGAVRLARRGRAFTYEPDAGGRAVLVPVQGIRAAGGTTAVVRVAVSERQLYAGTLASWLALAGLGAGLMLAALLVADRLGARLVGTVRRLAGVADRLARGELTARAALAGPPELRLVAGELNHLAGRIDALLTAEREHAADLAHRLRTPLAALRLDAEGLRDGAQADRVAADVAALERGVDEVIRMARKPLHAGSAPAADLADVARGRASFWLPLAEDQGRALTVHTPPDPVPVRVAADELAAVLDALIGNVFDHTPPGTDVYLSVDPPGVLTVADEGPGFPPGHEARQERGESPAGSTGLGLSIARRAAEESGGAVRLGAGAGGGAVVTAEFGAASDGSGAVAGEIGAVAGGSG